MKKVTRLSVATTTIFYTLCGCMQYAAFGDKAPGNLRTGFRLFEPFWLIDIANFYAFVESRAAAVWPESAFISKELRVGPFAPSVLRLVWRSAFVCLATVVTMALPFFRSVVGLVGAFTFWPLTAYFPVEVYIKQLSLYWAISQLGHVVLEQTRLLQENQCTTTIFYMLCGCMQYAAFGDKALDNLRTGFCLFEPFWLIDIANVAIVVHLIGAYQVFWQPIYAFVESRAAAEWPESVFISKELRVGPFAPSALRLVWPSAFVCLATVVAMALPFFGSVVGLHVEVYIKQLGWVGHLLERTRVLQDDSANGGFKGSLTGTSTGVNVTSTQKDWHSMQGDIAFGSSFSNILIEVQDTIKTPPPTESKVTRGRRRYMRSSSPTRTTGAFIKRSSSGMRIARACEAVTVPEGRSHRTPNFTRTGDSLTCDWFRIMGCCTVINRDGSCVICAAVTCMEAQYRRLHGYYHGVNACFLKVSVDAVNSLKKMCKERKAWKPHVGARTVKGILDVIRSLDEGLRTVRDNISLRIESYESFQVSKLSPLKVTSMLQKMGPMIGVLYAGRGYFRSAVYRGYNKAFPANHAVVCTGYRYIDGELFIIIMDNVAREGPFRSVLYEAFEEFHVLTVDAT